MTNNTYANCVGYALERCYSCGTEITGYIENDEQHLAMLKELVKEYEKACELVDDVRDLMWRVSPDLLHSIKSATVLSELYDEE